MDPEVAPKVEALLLQSEKLLEIRSLRDGDHLLDPHNMLKSPVDCAEADVSTLEAYMFVREAFDDGTDHLAQPDAR